MCLSIVIYATHSISFNRKISNSKMKWKTKLNKTRWKTIYRYQIQTDHDIAISIPNHWRLFWIYIIIHNNKFNLKREREHLRMEKKETKNQIQSLKQTLLISYLFYILLLFIFIESRTKSLEFGNFGEVYGHNVTYGHIHKNSIWRQIVKIVLVFFSSFVRFCQSKILIVGMCAS